MATNTFYKNEAEAVSDVNSRTHDYIAFICPFTHEERACGSWCPLFEIAGHTRSHDGVVLTHVALRCGDGKKAFHSAV